MWRAQQTLCVGIETSGAVCEFSSNYSTRESSNKERQRSVHFFLFANLRNLRGFSQFNLMAKALSILIVEDEFLIRMYMEDLFRDAGFAVTGAASGDEAAALLNGFDVVITDVEMPGELDGVALAWAVYARSEDVPIILMSGRVLPPKLSLPPTAHFFAKPVASDVLLERVSELVNSHPHTG